MKVDEKELEGEAMEGIETLNEGGTDKAPAGGKSATGSGGSARSQSMSVSVTSVSGADGDEDDA